MARHTNSILINLLNYTDGQLVGAGVFTKNILSHWLSLEDRHVTIYHSSSIDPVKVFHLPEKHGITLKSVHLPNLFIRIFYEQFIIPFILRDFAAYFSPNPVAPFLARLASSKTKIVITIHDMIPFFVRKKYGWFRSLYVRFISKYGARIADRVITVSENSKQDICAIAGIDPGKVCVIYNFIPGVFSANVEDGKFFLSISTIEPGKNIEGTMRAFKTFLEKQNTNNYKFYWVGKIGWGYNARQLTDLIASHDLVDKFVLLGFVSNEEKGRLLKKCTALVYLSHYEGFGLPVLEGLLFNKPAIVGNTSSLPEVVGMAGVLTNTNDAEEVADAMYEIATNRKKYELEIPAQVKKFNKDDQIKKFCKVLNEVLN